MHIHVNNTGKEIVETLSSISGYRTKMLTKTEVFDKELGIIPKKIKIQMTSLVPSKYIGNSNTYYNTFITVDNIVLMYKYYVIDMQINYIRNDGTIVNIMLINNNNGNKTDLAIKIEAVIHQFLKNLDKKSELGIPLEV